MDTEFESTVNNLLQDPVVKGVLIADQHGLCITSKGVSASSSSGFFVSMIEEAKKLGDENPTLCLETSEHKIYVKEQNGYVIAIYKSQPQ